MARKKPPRRRFRPFCWLIRAVVILLLAGTGLMLSGVPGPWVSAVLNRMDRVPGRVELERLEWQPGGGWSLEEVRWFSPRDLTRPLFTASRMQLLFARGELPIRFRIVEGRLETNAGVWTRDLTTEYPLLITDIAGEIGMGGDRISFSPLECRIADIGILVQGGLELTQPKQKLSFPDVAEKVGAVLRPLIPFLDGLGNLSSPEPLQFLVEIDGSTTHPRMQLQLRHTRPFTVRGTEFALASLLGELEDQSLSIREFSVETAEGRHLSGSSEVNFREKLFDVELENTLAREVLEALSPVSLDALLSNLDLRVEGQSDFSLKIGPSPFKNPGQRISGSFQVKQGSFRDAFFPEVDFRLELENSHLRLPEFSGRIGTGKRAGEVSGNLEMDGKRGLFRLNVEGAAHPDLAVSLVGPQVESIIREWEFKGKPPEFKLGVDQPDPQAPLQVNLLIQAEQAVWRGTLFQHIRAVTTLDGEGLRIRELVASRGSHQLEGSLRFPTDLSRCTLTLESSFPLPDIIPLLGQQAMDVIRPVQFRGSTRFSVSGVVDMTPKHQHDLSGEAVLERVVMDWILFENLQSSFVLKGQQLDLPEIEGQLVEGSLKAKLQLREVLSPKGTFAVDLQVKDVDLFKLITRATDRDSTPYTGTLGLDLQLTGALRDSMEERRVNTFVGKGRVEIRKGELFRIPLLLGLSNILSKVVKGFGYAAQGDLDADFVVRDGWLNSGNIFLGGSVISIAGTGGYGLEDRKLSGNIKIQLLKDGLMSDALRVLLWPIRKLIEVQLTGTLDNPDWRPRNLPKELFGK